jgi:hypothetical protein
MHEYKPASLMDNDEERQKVIDIIMRNVILPNETRILRLTSMGAVVVAIPPDMDDEEVRLARSMGWNGKASVKVFAMSKEYIDLLGPQIGDSYKNRKFAEWFANPQEHARVFILYRTGALLINYQRGRPPWFEFDKLKLAFSIEK